MPNSLIKESSPYLLQHAHNPVNWYAWGAEAIQLAQSLNRPIFLSIGYSSCHWCHVMEHESFSSIQVAEVLNEFFICIKVDREERPDVDHRYMQAIQAMGLGGGWPLNVFLTPETQAFYGGTYFPPEDRQGQAGFKTILQSVAKHWESHAQDLRLQAGKIESAILDLKHKTDRQRPYLGRSYIEHALTLYIKNYDSTHGGFGSSPKFPSPHDWRFLITQGKEYWPMVQHTLQRMAFGGIHDQIGGGIHRYSTDSQWFIPHFEKMLYDQASVLDLLARFNHVQPNPLWQEFSESIANYVMRDLKSPDHLFYCAEDADSEGVEGRFYLWNFDELASLLSIEELQIMRHFWGVQAQGNILHDPHGDFGHGNHLAQRMSKNELAVLLDRDLVAIEKMIFTLRTKLMQVRSQRTRPLLDTKTLTDWNAMMIGALAVAGKSFSNSHWITQAVLSMHALENHAFKQGQWVHCARPGQESIPAYREDLVWLIHAYLELFEATQDSIWISKAAQLDLLVLDIPDSYLTDYDGAHAGGYAVQAHNLIRLHQHLTQDSYMSRVIAIFEQFAQDLWNYPTRHGHLLSALHQLIPPSESFLTTCDDRGCRRV